MTTKQYVTFLREKRIPLVRGSRSPIMKQARGKDRKCSQCLRIMEHPTSNQRVHGECLKAWKRRYHAKWWKRKGADIQRRRRADARIAA